MRSAFVVLCAVALLGSRAMAGGGPTTVGASSLKVLESAGNRAGQAWAASTAYSAGETIKVGGRFYFALVAGTTGTSAPSGIDDIADGTVTWRSALHDTRSGMFIANEDSSANITVWWSAVSAGNGITLGPKEKIVFSGDGTPQSTVYLISDTASTSVTVKEW